MAQHERSRRQPLRQAASAGWRANHWIIVGAMPSCARRPSRGHADPPADSRRARARGSRRARGGRRERGLDVVAAHDPVDEGGPAREARVHRGRVERRTSAAAAAAAPRDRSRSPRGSARARALPRGDRDRSRSAGADAAALVRPRQPRDAVRGLRAARPSSIGSCAPTTSRRASRRRRPTHPRSSRSRAATSAGRSACRADGHLAHGGISPTIIQWFSDHPADVLPDAGCRLESLVLRHPEAPSILHALRFAGLCRRRPRAVPP